VLVTVRPAAQCRCVPVHSNVRAHRNVAKAAQVKHRKRDAYTPNQLPSTERAWNLFLAFILTAYGLAGVLTHTLQYSRRGRVIIFLEGGSAWLMSFALLVGACVFVSWVVDHYDKRNNEQYYRAFRWTAVRIGWALVASSLMVHMYVGLTR
jgi:uncharacterized membrane protein